MRRPARHERSWGRGGQGPIAGALLALALLGRPVVARAEEGLTAYETHRKEATSLYLSGRYEEAIEEFRAAYAVFANPKLLLNMGHAYLKLQRPREALRNYNRYVEKRLAQGLELEPEVPGYLSRAEALRDRQEEPPPSGYLADGTLLAQGPAPRSTPLHQRWWLWTTVGAVLVGGAVAGALIATRQGGTSDAPLETYRPRF